MAAQKTALLHLLPYMVKSKVFVATVETAEGGAG